MPGVRWSQTQLLMAAAEALGDWQASAAAVGVKVEQVTISLIPPTVEGEPAPTTRTAVVFEWDEAAQEYTFRTLDQ